MHSCNFLWSSTCTLSKCNESCWVMISDFLLLSSQRLLPESIQENQSDAAGGARADHLSARELILRRHREGVQGQTIRVQKVFSRSVSLHHLIFFSKTYLPSPCIIINMILQGFLQKSRFSLFLIWENSYISVPIYMPVHVKNICLSYNQLCLLTAFIKMSFQILF